MPPDAVAAILPLLPPPVDGLVDVPPTVIVTPAQGFRAVSMKVDTPVQPLLFLAVTL